METILETNPVSTLARLWERVLGERFRALHRVRQLLVLTAVGCDDGFCCPLAMAYAQPAHLWTRTEWDGLVSQMDFQEFIHWHDRAPGHELNQLRAWLTAQMEASHAKRE